MESDMAESKWQIEDERKSKELKREKIENVKMLEAFINQWLQARKSLIIDESKVTRNPGEMCEETNIGIEKPEENKFIPASGSESNTLLAVTCQQNIDPGIIFRTESFCGISQVINTVNKDLTEEEHRGTPSNGTKGKGSGEGYQG